MKHFDYVTLNNGEKIPQIGIGVFDIPDGPDTVNTVRSALETGYRHIDTAHSYENERSVGKAVKESMIPREEIWITSKLWPSDYGEGITSGAIDKMLARLDTEYIDLLLLHQQFGDIYGAWNDMEKALSDGRIRAVGISNFDGNRLKEFMEKVSVKPAVLQVECHPYFQQKETKAFLAQYGTTIESWYPLGHGDSGLLGDHVFTEPARKYGKSSAQIILRWQIQEGNIVFPKASSEKHLKENLNIFDFELTPAEMEKIRLADRNQRFFTMPLEEQEKNFTRFVPAD